LEAAEEAAGILAADGIETTIWDVRVVRPLDPQMLADAGRHKLVVTVEGGIRTGGAGAFITDTMADLFESRAAPPVLVLGIPVAYVPHGEADRILAQLGLDGPGIAADVAKALPRRDAADG
ncbi:MAG TPA: transketolase C-terminal domain-containing protein, partial [Acidimicrobiales bacterium]|nr:transketolase C-terminal domain-containing protein [Acidimicrobiales bacterium]